MWLSLWPLPPPSPTSTKTASSRMFVLLSPPSWNISCNRGDSSSSQQLDTTETKLRTSKAICHTRQWHELFTHDQLCVTHRLRLRSVAPCVFCWPATRPCLPQEGRRVCGIVCRSCRRPIGSLSGYWWAAVRPSEDTRRRKGSDTQTAPGARCILRTSPVTDKEAASHTAAV